MKSSILTLLLPEVTKTEFLLTITNNIKQTSYDNKEKYQLWDCKMIQY